MFGDLFGGLFGPAPKVEKPVGEIMEHEGVRYMLLEQCPAFPGAFYGVRENEEGQFCFWQPVHLVTHMPTRRKMEDEQEAQHRRTVLSAVAGSQKRTVLKPDWKATDWEPEPYKHDHITPWDALAKSGDCPEKPRCPGRAGSSFLALVGVRREEGQEEFPPFLPMLCDGHRAMVEEWLAAHPEVRLPSKPGEPRQVKPE